MDVLPPRRPTGARVASATVELGMAAKRLERVGREIPERGGGLFLEVFVRNLAVVSSQVLQGARELGGPQLDRRLDGRGDHGGVRVGEEATQ